MVDAIKRCASRYEGVTERWGSLAAGFISRSEAARWLACEEARDPMDFCVLFESASRALRAVQLYHFVAFPFMEDEPIARGFGLLRGQKKGVQKNEMQEMERWLLSVRERVMRTRCNCLLYAIRLSLYVG